MTTTELLLKRCEDLERLASGLTAEVRLLAQERDMLWNLVPAPPEQRECANSTCRMVFFPSRPNKIYCSHACQNSERQRDYRARRAATAAAELAQEGGAE